MLFACAIFTSTACDSSVVLSSYGNANRAHVFLGLFFNYMYNADFDVMAIYTTTRSILKTTYFTHDYKIGVPHIIKGVYNDLMSFEEIQEAVTLTHKSRWLNTYGP